MGNTVSALSDRKYTCIATSSLCGTGESAKEKRTYIFTAARTQENIGEPCNRNVE